MNFGWVFVLMVFLSGCEKSVDVPDITLYVATPNEVLRKKGGTVDTLISQSNYPDDRIYAMAHSRTQGLVAISLPSRMLLFDEEAKRVVFEKRITPEDSNITSMAFSPDGLHLALMIDSSSGDKVGLYDLRDQRFDSLTSVNNAGTISYGLGEKVYFDDF